MPRGGIALFLLVASACGAKSNLLLAGSGGRSGAAGVAGSGGGAGVAGTGGASGSGGGAGTAGSAGAAGSGGDVAWATGTTCYGFVDRGSRLIDLQNAQRAPGLVISSNDGSRVALACQLETPFGSPNMPTLYGLEYASFNAWQDWPSTSLAPTFGILGRRVPFAFARGFNDRFAAFTGYGDPDTSPGLYLATTITPDAVFSGGINVDAHAPASALFVTRGSVDHLFGYSVSSGGSVMLVTGRQPDGALPILSGTGCATDSLHAAAVRLPGRYLVATTSSRPFGDCLNDNGVDGPADRFQVALVPDSGQASLTWEWQQIIDQIAMVPRSDGAWIAWKPRTNATPGPIMAARLDLDGQLLTLPNSFVDYGMSAFAFAADRVADDLALAWIEATDPSEPTIHVGLYDQDALNTPHLAIQIQPAPSEWPVGPLALLGSPDGQHLLVSWEAMDGQGRSIVVTRRLDCVGLD